MSSNPFNEKIVIAHRASNGVKPQNTIESLVYMSEKGAKWFEVDVWLMKDGNIAVIHDQDVRKTTNGTGLITDKVFADLRDIIVDGGNGTETIPLLKDVMKYICSQEGRYLVIDVKGTDTGLADAVHSLIQEYDCGRFIIDTFEEDIVTTFLSYNPSYEIYWSNPVWRIPRHIRKAKEYKVGMSVYHYSIIPILMPLSRLIKNGVPTDVYTVNDATKAMKYFKQGAGRIFTDEYFILQQALEELQS